MSEVVLKAQRRDIGKKASKAIRNKGLVTGIYYFTKKSNDFLYSFANSMSCKTSNRLCPDSIFET